MKAGDYPCDYPPAPAPPNLRKRNTGFQASSFLYEGGVQATMFFSLRDLELQKIEFAEQFAPELIDLGPELRQVTPIKTSGRAELLREHGGEKVIEDIRVVGELSTKLELKCARCLDPVRVAVKSQMDLIYRPLETLADGRDEVSISAEEAEIGYYKGEGLLLEDVLKEQVLLAVPQKPLCSEACKGFCPHCGKNLNQTSCDCAASVADPRWAALAEIKEKLKQ